MYIPIIFNISTIYRLDSKAAMYASKVITQTKMGLMRAVLHKRLHPSPTKSINPPDLSVDPMDELRQWLSERMKGTLSTTDIHITSHSKRYAVLKFLWDMSKLTSCRVPKDKQIMVIAEPNAGQYIERHMYIMHLISVCGPCRQIYI